MCLYKTPCFEMNCMCQILKPTLNDTKVSTNQLFKLEKKGQGQRIFAMVCDKLS